MSADGVGRMDNLQLSNAKNWAADYRLDVGQNLLSKVKERRRLGGRNVRFICRNEKSPPADGQL